jgi:hypothetical protein
LAHMSISTYFRPNIHQNGPGILVVNTLFSLLNQVATNHKPKNLNNSEMIQNITISWISDFSHWQLIFFGIGNLVFKF